MMADAVFRLENSWEPVEGDPCGRFVFTLVNLSDAPLSGFKLAYTSLTRIKDAEEPRCDNATFLIRNANFHQFAPPSDVVLEPGEAGASRSPRSGARRATARMVPNPPI